MKKIARNLKESGSTGSSVHASLSELAEFSFSESKRTFIIASVTTASISISDGHKDSPDNSKSLNLLVRTTIYLYQRYIYGYSYAGTRWFGNHKENQSDFRSE
jgi:hypothetical protein